MTHVMHVITDLDCGGAEMMLKRLVEAEKEGGAYRHTVVSLKGIGKVGPQLEELGVKVTALEMHSAAGFASAVWRLARQMRREQVDIVQTWMYHGNLVGGLAARFAGKRRVIWCVHSTAIPQSRFSPTGVVVWLGARLSRALPETIVCCAVSAREAHERKGYDAAKMTVVPNGYDLRAFSPSAELRERARAGFGFKEEELVVGTVGRFDRLKDYPNFLRAASALCAGGSRVRFLMVGRGLEAGNGELGGWLSESGVGERFVLAGERQDAATCLAAMDVFCLSSLAEAFPNAVCEAMAMKVPCVVTDVGDAARIVGETGEVVAAGDAADLEAGLRRMLEKDAGERARLGDLARERIAANYSMASVAAQFEAIYKGLLSAASDVREGLRAEQTQ